MLTLEVQGIIHSYKERIILSDIYLKCNNDEIIAIIGLNGSGKTTMFKIMSGLLKSNNSFVYLNKKRLFKKEKYIKYCSCVNILPGDVVLRKLIKYLFSEDIKLKIYENKIIKDNENKKIKHLSSGTIKYIQVIFFLYMDCPFVILDEPFLGLSPLLSEQLISVIKECSVSKGIIITDHNYDYLKNLTNKFYKLSNGSLKPLL